MSAGIHPPHHPNNNTTTSSPPPQRHYYHSTTIMAPPATPRKPRNPRNNRGQPRVPDYDSDHHRAGSGYAVPHGGPSTPAAAVPAAQSHPGGYDAVGGLNFRVLLRYMPTIQSYDRVAHSATVYKHNDHAWSAADIKGPLFICSLPPHSDTHTGQLLPRACVFIMNRLNLENLKIDLDSVFECDLEGDFIMFTTPSASGEVDVWGIYVSPEAMQASWSAIHSGWKAAKGIAHLS